MPCCCAQLTGLSWRGCVRGRSVPLTLWETSLEMARQVSVDKCIHSLIKLCFSVQGRQAGSHGNRHHDECCFYFNITAPVDCACGR